MATDAPTRSRRTLIGKILVGAVIAISVGVWAVAVFGRFEVPGRMNNRTFATGAEAVCKAARERIAALPRAFETSENSARADVVDRATDELDAMLRELRRIAPTAPPEQAMVAEWLADWQTYLGDRRDYATRLRSDRNARFYVHQSDRDKVQITVAIDRFANVNDMVSCKTSDDVG